MPGFPRRRFLHGIVAAGVATVGSSVVGSPRQAWATESRPATSLHEQLVRDARLVWTTLPTAWSDAPFLGNGALTAQLYGAAGGAGLIIAIGAANRPWGEPIARLRLELTGTVTAVRWQLDPWDAELTGTVTTTRASLSFAALVHRERDVVLISLAAEGRGVDVTVSEESPDRAAESAVSWQERRSGSRRVIMISTRAQEVRSALDGNLDTLVTAHRRGWNEYYQRSLVSIPDKTLQRFYWIQLYTAASVLRAEPAFARQTPAMLTSSNHLELHPVTTAVDKGGWPQTFDHLAFGIPGAGSRNGGADNPISAWNLPMAWAGYEHSREPRILREVLHPLLRSAVDFYAGYLTEESDGYLHLPTTYSPEYADVEDCTYDLSLLRWSVRKLIDATQQLEPESRELDRWRHLNARLAAFPTGPNGALVGAGVPLADSHRHASHLQWLYPLAERTWAVPADRDVMRRSFDHWSSMRASWDVQSHLLAASMSVAMHDPEPALKDLTSVVGGARMANTELLSSTLCRRGVRSDKSVPFQAAQVMLDMLVSGNNGAVDVFPAVSARWRDISISGLRAPGGFVIDASRSAGQTDWVRVRSEAGQPMVLNHSVQGVVDVIDTRGRTVRHEPAGTNAVLLRLGVGDTAMVIPRGAKVHARPRSVPGAEAVRQWGLDSRKNGRQ